MNAHVGVDTESRLVDTAGVTPGNVPDAKVMDGLIAGTIAPSRAIRATPATRRRDAPRAAGVPWAVKESNRGVVAATPARLVSRRNVTVMQKILHQALLKEASA
jgi:hypothetical protein